MTKKKWDRHEILAVLRRRRITLAKLAEIYDLKPHSVRHVWTRPNSKVEAAIADFLATPVEELFADRYPKRTATILSSKYEQVAASPKSTPAGNVRNAA